MRTLQAAFERVLEMGYITNNPFIGVKKLKPTVTPPVFPSLDDLSKILEAESDVALRTIYLFAFYTGMRMGEIRSVRWPQIDLQASLISLTNDETFKTKSRKYRFIPIHPLLKELMALRDKTEVSSSGHIFTLNGLPYKKDYLSRHFKAACKKACVSPKLHFHSLRHGYASLLVQMGTPLYYVKDLLGHQSITTTEVYSHLMRQELTDAVVKIPSIALGPLSVTEKGKEANHKD